MDRRQFLHAGVAAGALGPAGLAARAGQAERHFYELRTYEMRSDIAPNRLRAFLQGHLIPALRRAGAGPVGAFTPDIGLLGQTVWLLIDYPTAADALAVPRRLEADAAYVAGLGAFERDAQLPYVRYESRLMRAFAGHPGLEVPPASGDASRRPRVFELRTYEARSEAALAKKIDMFDQAEIALFRSIGMAPVFFAQDVFAPRLPSLTYMVAFDDVAARTAAWRTFGSHPEWQRISRDQRWAIEGGNTSVTSVVGLLNPLPFSQLR
jgi:hypothetical protein